MFLLIVTSLLHVIWLLYTLVATLTLNDKYMWNVVDLWVMYNVTLAAFYLKRMLFLTTMVHHFNCKV